MTQYVHPLSAAIREIARIFGEMGFAVADGPELEDAWHNFDALNIPKDHPARDMQDTFWLPLREGESQARVMRTHTSPVQVRWMETHEPPIRIVVPGKAYRNEATDMTHEAQFYQVEGLVVDETTSLAHLKGTLARFFGEFFGGAVEVRLRPSFFAFTEPSVEVDMRLSGEDAPAKLKGKWIEVMGAGMVHPKVLNAAGIDPATYQGFAFGGGIERLAMLKWGIDDVRLFHAGDLRLPTQFPAYEG
ncbi:MAG TPA: phenylalanine--tRNA ligase subunit alpha [Candidatus Paceibacterota bacterium]|nr:phenylalanine--tRNA ligase subunit alpha [Candidatus Paceibacterota bacterium]